MPLKLVGGWIISLNAKGENIPDPCHEIYTKNLTPNTNIYKLGLNSEQL